MNGGKSGRAGSVVGGLVLIGIGLWFLLTSLNVPLPGLDRFWPIFPTLGGLVFVAAFLFGAGGDSGMLVPGVGGFLIGLLFFAITLGPLEWNDLGRLWPLFPLIGGIAFVAAWLGNRRAGGLLFVGGLAIAVGVVGLAFTLASLSLGWLVTWWPLLLILVGLLMLAQSLLGRHR